ncbi:DUF3850 domain-containing protein [Shinella curvata]|uniref:DUF3850 domain-containing protein n=1 Tax=Shinella curvata TaxID=1817964 RepID=A0ABT8XIR6_9HYPH|nr:DUF3850 domain-containing protein [Shinella curvata]MCJ8053809.1 DUF3850 domain-containing protein [Shinella curvata]MDO6123141.1 DUF3850 domain-containing protein [Shinella curvata]
MKTHVLKCWTEQFRDVQDKRKTFEFRRNDRNFAVGDVLDLRDFSPETQLFSGSSELRRITHILSAGFGLPEGYAVLSLEPVECCGRPAHDGDPCGYILECCERYRAPMGDGTLLDAIQHESWDLRCFNIPTGGDDCDIGWSVIGHWQAEPHERVIAEIYHDDPRAAIRAAIAASGNGGGE